MKIVKLLTLIVVLCLSTVAEAQHRGEGRQRGRRPDKTEWLEKMKRYKHDFLTRELGLTEKQQQEFFPLYDAKEEERFKAVRAVRRNEKRTLKMGDSATDADFDRCIKEQYELDVKMAEIEKRYLPRFRKVLTRRQLFRLRHAEREFQRTLMEQRQNCPPPPPQK